MLKPIPFAILAAALVVSACGPSSPTDPYQARVNAVSLHQPAWLQGTWSMRSKDVAKSETESEEIAIGENYVAGTTDSGHTSGANYFSTKGQWSLVETIASLNATPQATSSDQLYRLDLVKDGQSIGFVQFEMKGDVLVYTEDTPQKKRTLELHKGKAAEVPITVILPSPTPTPSPVPMQTSYLSLALPANWEKTTSLQTPAQWENFLYLQRKDGKSVIATIALDRTTEDVDLETVKDAWVANAGKDALEVKKTEVMGLPAYLVRRTTTLSGGTTMTRKYLVAKDARVYSFGLVNTKDDSREATLVAEFDSIVNSVKWTSSTTK